MANIKQENKGSVLVFSLIMLSLILTSALAIGAATVIERKSSLTSNKSTQGFQAADTGVEIAMKKLRATNGNLSSVLSPSSCDATPTLTDTTLGYTVTFKNKTGGAMACGDYVSSVGSVHSVGTSGNTTRAVEAPFIYYQDRVLTTPGLVSYWKMDDASWTNSGDVKDSYGGNHGTASGGATTSATNKYGTRSGSFTGSAGNSIGIADSSSLRFGTGSFTIEGWFDPSSLTSTDDANGVRWFSKDNYCAAWTTTPSCNWIVGQFSSTGIISLSGRGYGDSAGFYIGTMANEIATSGGWYHVVFVVDRVNSKGYVYVNGVNKSGTGVNISSLTGNLNMDKVGTLVQLSSTWMEYSGFIDEVAIYDRALTAAEIKSHY